MTVTSNGSSTNYSYSGDPIKLKIKGGTSYTLTFGNVANYKTPDSVTFTASAGTTRNLNYSYNATLLTINVTGLASGDASKGTITVKYGSTTVTKTNGQTVLIPYGQSVTCTPATVSNYKSPSSSTFTTSSATKTVTMNYQSVTLTIKITGLASTSGVKITVSGSGMTTQQVSHNGTARVPYNTTVNFTIPDVEGYNKPTIASAKYTSNKTITVAYEEIVGGVFIMDTSGNLISPYTWTGGSNATGVVLINDNVSICMAPAASCNYDDDTGTCYQWGPMYVNATGCTSSTPQNGGSTFARTDYKGESNTTAMINSLSGIANGNYGGDYTGSPAAEYCRSYSKGCKGRGSWYLPAAGEWNEVEINKDEIDFALDAISANYKASDVGGGNFWSSTQMNYGDPDEEYEYGEAWLDNAVHANEKWCEMSVVPFCRV